MAQRVRRRTRVAGRGLTLQERRIARLISEGKHSKEISRELNLSLAQIKHRLLVIYRLLGLENRTQLGALVARRPALFSLPSARAVDK